MRRSSLVHCLFLLLSPAYASGQDEERSNDYIAPLSASKTPAKSAPDPIALAPTEFCGCTDLVFLVDVTGSMGGAIENIKAELPTIIDQALIRSNGDLRLSLITFRDNVMVNSPLTTTISLVQTELNNMNATGGGGGPEASDEALREMLNVSSCLTGAVGFNTPFRNQCSKIAILITDNFPGGCDDFYTPGVDNVNAHAMALLAAEQGVVIHSVLVGSFDPVLDAIMEDYATVTEGTFSIIPPDGTGIALKLVDIIALCPQPSPLQITVFDAGNPDGFDPPQEISSPSPVLAPLLLDCADGQMQFDEVVVNKCFGHTFTGLPPNIVFAEVEIRLRAASAPDAELQCNDLINFQTTGLASPKFLWTGRLGTGGPFASCDGEGLIPVAWLADTDYTITLDLAQLPNFDGTFTNILDSLNTEGQLDIRVNDDTGVDYVRLTVMHDADCNDNGVFDFEEFDPVLNGFENGSFSGFEFGWTPQAFANIDYDGDTVTITSRDDGLVDLASISQGLMQFDDGLFEFDLMSYTSVDVSLWDYPIVIVNGLHYGLNLDGTLTSANGIGTVRNANEVLTPIHYVVDAMALDPSGIYEIGFGVDTLNSSNGPGIAVFDNVGPSVSNFTIPNCNSNDLLDICEINDTYSGLDNGGFDNMHDSWRHHIQGNGSIEYHGHVQVTGDDALAGGVTYTDQETFQLTDGILEFDLVSYTSTDTGLWDLPVIVIDEIPFGLNHDGTLTVNNGIGSIRNDDPLLTPLHFTVDVNTLTGPGAHDIGFGVRSINGSGGPGIAIFDNITPGLVLLDRDCNLDGLLDSCEIDDDPNLDLDLNGVLDSCECHADCDDAGPDSFVNVNDLLELLANWGPAPGFCDIDPPGGNGEVNVNDLLAILTAWGSCPP